MCIRPHYTCIDEAVRSQIDTMINLWGLHGILDLSELSTFYFFIHTIFSPSNFPLSSTPRKIDTIFDLNPERYQKDFNPFMRSNVDYFSKSLRELQANKKNVIVFFYDSWKDVKNAEP